MLKNLMDGYQRWAARRMFARWSPIYEAEVADNHYSAAEWVADAAIPLLSDIESPQIVDIGIGTGLLSARLKKAVPCTVFGLDFCEDMMALALHNEACDRLCKCDVGRDRWPLEPGSQHMAVSAGLFEYLMPGMARHVLAEAANILAPGGRMVFTYMPRETGEKDVQFWRGHSGTYLIAGYLPAGMAAMVEHAGFAILDHSQPFAGCVFQDGSSYPYRLVVAQKA